MSLNKRVFTGGPAPVENAFKAVTYSGNSGNQSISGLGFKPDLIWIKERSSADAARLLDSTRGVNSRLFPSETNSASVISGTLNSFDNDGFTVGSAAEVNQNGQTYVAWAWACNGGTTSTNSDGNRNSTVQVNNDTGLSIVNYTGGDTGIGGSDTVGHGLTGIPRFIIGKSTNWANNWITYLHDGTNYYHGYLDGNGALTKNGSNTQVGTSSSLPTSSVINPSHVGTDNSNYDYMFWCWEPKEGYSKFGSYTGTGSAGHTINVGFAPALVIVRSTANAEDWLMFDSARGNNKVLYANTDAAEATYNTFGLTSTGFELPQWGSSNGNGQEYIYAAWREAT